MNYSSGGIIKTAAAELITVHIMTELDKLLNDAATMLANDLELDESIAKDVINIRFKQLINGLKDTQLNADCSAVYFNLAVSDHDKRDNFFLTDTGRTWLDFMQDDDSDSDEPDNVGNLPAA